MSTAAQARLWTKDFTLGTAVNFLLMVNYYGLMVVVADYAMKTYDAPAATAGLAASIFLSLIHIFPEELMAMDAFDIALLMANQHAAGPVRMRYGTVVGACDELSLIHI